MPKIILSKEESLFTTKEKMKSKKIKKMKIKEDKKL